MTMINPPPPHSISEQNRCGGGYVGLMGRLEEAGGYECCTLGSGLFIGPMAEDESRTESVNEEGSSSKGGAVVVQDEEMRDQGWLQLGIGPIGGPSQDRAQPIRSGLVELDLLPGGGVGLEQVMTSSSSAAAAAAVADVVYHVQPNLRDLVHPNVSSSFVWQYPGGNSGSGFPHHQKINTNWGFRPQNMTQNIMMPFPATASTSTFLMPGGSYLSRPFPGHSGGGVDVGGGVGSSSSFSVIDPPRRPHSGLWFVLQVSQNQSKEPFLPQIPKSYLRIKDGRMTVRLLMKYLVNKLKLDSESEYLHGGLRGSAAQPRAAQRVVRGESPLRSRSNDRKCSLRRARRVEQTYPIELIFGIYVLRDKLYEIEIRCRGQQLLPFLTLQHVRDHIWRSSTDATTITLLPDSSTSDHVMVLHYARNP